MRHSYIFFFSPTLLCGILSFSSYNHTSMRHSCVFSVSPTPLCGIPAFSLFPLHFQQNMAWQIGFFRNSHDYTFYNNKGKLPKQAVSPYFSCFSAFSCICIIVFFLIPLRRYAAFLLLSCFPYTSSKTCHGKLAVFLFSPTPLCGILAFSSFPLHFQPKYGMAN